MALSKSVEESLKEAEGALRNALAFAARQEQPYVGKQIAEMIMNIDQLQKIDKLFDKLENREPGSSGSFGNFFDDNE
ncbi:hypothetical protein S820908_146 [Synechococcus phage S-CAM9]|uniref:Uncharacterized protein n=1 Tax=Synechococcus phage S-CAM9 TaxID=1883369 RepID=A0A1D8KPC5_9CAUD|nr:hypothetical protein BOW85_gp102 [Synechococcus phage S-CAM9]AOV60293.1 hypothetical protein S050808_146 [Synechococcus phage S-CAM9]AOV60521.1 hypothetical protein S820908_146 [Synechococcus phage S-CAM9]AOV60750.1 hypothetical protein N161109_147 [Synechococcus phage S-CAM9]